MGPRLQERGVANLDRFLAEMLDLWLQWGRAYKSAEFEHPSFNVRMPTKLQWGRAYKSAELESEL